MNETKDLHSQCTESMTDLVSAGNSYEEFEKPANFNMLSSVFPDTECGEPATHQCLRINFTPVEEDNDDVVQKKCCDFWEYINGRSDLKKMMMVPEHYVHDVSPESTSISKNVDVAAEDGKTAISMLEFVEGQGLIDKTFEAKLPKTSCSLESQEYLLHDAIMETKHMRQKKKLKGSKSGDMNRSSASIDAAPAVVRSPELQFMCSRMAEWDKTHAKSNLPGPAPSLDSVLQRNIFYT